MAPARLACALAHVPRHLWPLGVRVLDLTSHITGCGAYHARSGHQVRLPTCMLTALARHSMCLSAAGCARRRLTLATSGSPQDQVGRLLWCLCQAVQGYGYGLQPPVHACLLTPLWLSRVNNIINPEFVFSGTIELAGWLWAQRLLASVHV